MIEADVILHHPDCAEAPQPRHLHPEGFVRGIRHNCLPYLGDLDDVVLEKLGTP